LLTGITVVIAGRKEMFALVKNPTNLIQIYFALIVAQYFQNMKHEQEVERKLLHLFDGNFAPPVTLTHRITLSLKIEQEI
jgi:hypothetical protein